MSQRIDGNIGIKQGFSKEDFFFSFLCDGNDASNVDIAFYQPFIDSVPRVCRVIDIVFGLIQDKGN